MVKSPQTPRLPRRHLVVADTDQKQLRHHRDAKRLLNAQFVLSYRMLAHPQVRFQLAIVLFSRPPLTVRRHNISGPQLGQIRQQNFSLTRTHVLPSFAQNHNDIPQVTQTQTGAVNPKGPLAIVSWNGWNPEPLVMFTMQMRHQAFDGFIIDRFLCSQNGEEQTPGAIWTVGISLHHHLHIILRTIGSMWPTRFFAILWH